MKRIILSALLATCAFCTHAKNSLGKQSLQQEKQQVAVKKVYDENLNSLEQINEAVAKAKNEGKFVIAQVGGNWCPWCLRFTDFITKDSTINATIENNFVYIHVNYPGRTAKLEGNKKEMVEQTMTRLGNPGRFGFPVMVVLDETGKPIHFQDSSYLEEGKGYNKEKVMRFFENWTPKALGK